MEVGSPSGQCGEEGAYPLEMGSMALGTNSGSECHLSNCLSSPRLHADPAVSENRWFLWGMVTSGQQHLVRLGEWFWV